jgi:hypothetical protein
MQTINRKQAFNAPASVFLHPLRVVQDGTLTHDEKVVVLRNWKHSLERIDARHGRGDGFERLEVEARLAAVNDALNALTTQH